MKDAKFYPFGILEKSEKSTAAVGRKHFERKDANQMYMAFFRAKRDTEKSISADV